MNQEDFYNNLFIKFKNIVKDNGLLSEKVEITGRSLTAEEAIGNTDKKNFPILEGKEKLLEADFRGAKGQAFTDMPGDFSGNLKDIIEMPLKTNFDMAVYIATLNAVCRYLKIIDNTIHCKDGDPEKCALKLVDNIKSKYGTPNIALIGFQPAMIQQLAKEFKIRVIDLDINNIGKIKYNVMIEDGSASIEELINWCDLLVATGSTIANKTITNFILDKPTLFFGTTLAGAAALMELERFCPCSK